MNFKRPLMVGAIAASAALAVAIPSHADQLLNAPSATAQSETATEQTFDGQTVFRGLFLGEGPVATAHPELQRVPMVSSTEGSEAWKDDLINDISQADPAFFERFGEAIQSGSRPAIQEASTEASAATVEALETRYGQPATQGDMGADCFFGPVAVAVAVVVTAAVLLNVAYGYNYVEAAARSADQEKGLAQERWIDDVAQAFS